MAPAGEKPSSEGDVEVFDVMGGGVQGRLVSREGLKQRVVAGVGATYEDSKGVTVLLGCVLPEAVEPVLDDSSSVVDGSPPAAVGNVKSRPVDIGEEDTGTIVARLELIKMSLRIIVLVGLELSVRRMSV